MGFIATLFVGGMAGWLAGRLMKGNGFGLFWNIILGLFGGFVGGHVLGWVGLEAGNGIVPQIVTSLIGAVIVLWVVSKFKK